MTRAELRVWLRSVFRSALLAFFFVEAGLELLLTRPSTRRQRAEWLHRFCARSLGRLGIAFTVHGSFPGRGFLIANHQTYLDIIVLAAIRPCVFVSKAEIAAIPVLGWMTTRSGAVYVERGRGASALRASAEMTTAANAGLPVVFFPEGTTNTSTELLPFRSGLLAQVLAGGEPITAACLSYTMGPDNPGRGVQENLRWGDLPMFTHAFRFLGLRGVRAEARFADRPIAFSSRDLHRKAAAAEAREAVGTLCNCCNPGAIEPSINLHAT